MLQKPLSFFRPGLTIPIDIFDQDDGGIDDDAEIDRADRQQIRIFVPYHQNDDAEEQRERDVGADDDRAAQITEEDPLNEENQQAAKNQVVQDRCGRDGHERGAVV